MIRSVIIALLFIPVLGLPPAASAYAGGSGSREFGWLAEKYSEVQARAGSRLSSLPIYVESWDIDNELNVDVYGVFRQPFGNVKKSLSSPENWCDVVPVHLNIKACTFKKNNGQPLVNFYSGRKFYQSPEDAFLLSYSFSVADEKPDYLLIRLNADKGPLDTLEHRLTLEAAPVDRDKTLVHFSYSHRYGLTAELALKSYFATLGRGKTGFSISGKGREEDPDYVGGLRGAIERNSVRYYFAIQAYMDTIAVPEKDRFISRLNRWFDLTEQFHAQLFEIERKAYIESKLRERKNQERLQRLYGR